MSATTVYKCDNPVCDHTTAQPDKSEWIVLEGTLKAYQGVRDGETGPAPAVTVGDFCHFCGTACLTSALSFPDRIEGEDASAEVEGRAV